MSTERKIKEVMASHDQEIHVLVGSNSVYVVKEFGPTIFASIRVTPSLDRGAWIIERMTGPNDEWKEYAEIPAQLDEDFEEIG